MAPFWRWWQKSGKMGRLLLVVLWLVVVGEGVGRQVALVRQVGETIPYNTFIGEVRDSVLATAVPADEIFVLGLHRYWLGLDAFPYRRWAVPLFQVGEGQDLRMALDELHPTVVLRDERMAAWGGNAANGTAVFEWLTVNHFVLTAVVDDPTYGEMQIWAIPP